MMKQLKFTPSLIFKIALVLLLAIAPFYVGYSFKHYFHVIGFMTLPFVVGLLPVLFNVKSLWKWAIFAAGSAITVIWFLANLFTRTHVAYLGADGCKILDKNDPNLIYTISEGDEEKLNGSSQIIFMNPNCETCRDTIPLLQKQTKNNQTDIVYVDVLTDFGKDYVKHFPEIEKVPTAYNRETGETLRLGFHTDNGTSVLKKNIEKIAESAK